VLDPALQREKSDVGLVQNYQERLMPQRILPNHRLPPARTT
jgi:hypothetical protein